MPINSSSSGPCNKANIFLGLIEYELNSLLGASHLVDYIYQFIFDSGDLRQGSSNSSVTNFVLGFPYIFQKETQSSVEDLISVVLVILRRSYVTRF